MPGVFEFENYAKIIAKKLFHGKTAEFRPLSGIHATLASIMSLTEPGDLMMSLPPAIGGHFATRPIVEKSGRRWKPLPWDHHRFDLDLDRLAKEIKINRPHAIIFDHGMPLFPLSVSEVRKIIGDECRLIYDASHTLGLIGGGAFQNPIKEGCEILQGNTHKTFPGPQKALIVTGDFETGRIIQDGLSQAIVSSQHTHHSLASYCTLFEMQAFSFSYARQIQANAQALAQALSEEGFRVISRGNEFTQSHMILVDQWRKTSMEDACHLLHKAGFSLNARTYEEVPVLRIGVQEMTRRGMGEKEMRTIGCIFRWVLEGTMSPLLIQKYITDLNLNFSDVKYSFDDYKLL